MLTLSIGRKKRLHAVTFSPSGRDLAAVGGDNVLRVWDSFTGDLKKIEKAGKHLLELINGVLDIAKIEAGKMEIHAEAFDVAAMINDVAATVAVSAFSGCCETGLEKRYPRRGTVLMIF